MGSFGDSFNTNTAANAFSFGQNGGGGGGAGRRGRSARVVVLSLEASRALVGDRPLRPRYRRPVHAQHHLHHAGGGKHGMGGVFASGMVFY